jgi:hypothetical protein
VKHRAWSGALAAVPVPHSIPGWHAAAADRELLVRLLGSSGSSGVDRRPAPPDASYLHDVTTSLAAGIAATIQQASDQLNLPRWLLVGAALVLLTVVAALLTRLWRERQRGRRREAMAAQATAVLERGAGVAGAESESWDAAAWRSELDRRLEEGRTGPALRAVWWWLARSLAGARAVPTWTGRELLRWARRDDLRDLVRELDLLTYGPRAPRVEEIRRLADGLGAALS